MSKQELAELLERRKEAANLRLSVANSQGDVERVLQLQAEVVELDDTIDFVRTAKRNKKNAT